MKYGIFGTNRLLENHGIFETTNIINDGPIENELKEFLTPR